MEKKKVFEFIQNWVKNDRNEELILEKSNTVEKGTWFNFHCKNDVVYIAIHESKVPLWYKRWAFDNSMNKEQKEEIKKESPMFDEIKKYYSEFIIDGELFYIKKLILTKSNN